MLPANGLFYGVQNNLAFSITPGGQFTTLLTFTGANGAYPSGDLILYNNALYGTTAGGGTYGQGVVYSLTRDGTQPISHSFGAQGDSMQQGGEPGLPKAISRQRVF